MLKKQLFSLTTAMNDLLPAHFTIKQSLISLQYSNNILTQTIKTCCIIMSKYLIKRIVSNAEPPPNKC